MKPSLRSLFLVVGGIAVLVSSCGDLRNVPRPTRPSGSTSVGQATPTAAVLADSFFFGCAYLDANGNGEIDPEDPGLKGAMFVVTPNGGGGFGAPTPDSGCATVVVPGGLNDNAWPVTTRMEPPRESGYESVGPAEVVLNRPESHADFLFAVPGEAD